MVILDRKLYNNAIEEIISDSSKFEKLNEDPTLKREASLQRFLRKLKQKNFFNEIEYNRIYSYIHIQLYILYSYIIYSVNLVLICIELPELIIYCKYA